MTADWIQALAAAAARTSQARVAEAIGYSASVVSQVLKGAYRGDVRKVEHAVRGALMAEKVSCPGMRRDIPNQECLGWQKKARHFGATNHVEARMFRACRRCPRFRTAGAAPESHTGEES